ncbi:MAG: phenylacetate--CoA ligase family protein [Verrucomicrobiota bacterium]
MDSRAELETDQLAALREVLQRCANAKGGYYAERILELFLEPAKLDSLDDFQRRFPLTSKTDLVGDREANSPYGSFLTEPVEAYTRFHRTSGTSGEPLVWLDTPHSWGSMLDGWEEILRRAGVVSGDSVFCAFSFGPFIGFWLAFEAASRMGCLAIPAGGLSSSARASLLKSSKANVLCCTPTYAMRLGEVVKETGTAHAVEKLIVAGEPGGSIPETRERLSSLWGGAAIFDHHGMTEVGPVSFESLDHPGFLFVLEKHFLAEVVCPEKGVKVEEGEIGELILTTLKRSACPLLRYRTGDLVRKRHVELDGVHVLALEGGILSRADDMVVVRGVNIYPSAVESVLRRFPEIDEYEVEISEQARMAEMCIRVEWNGPDEEKGVEQLGESLRDAFALRIPIELAEAGSLERYEFKSKRWRWKTP